MAYIKGVSRTQVSMFSSLDDMVGKDNIVRVIDWVVEEIVKANPREFRRAGLSRTGRPAYAPQVFLKLFLYGYLKGISSSRKLEEATHNNLEVMWLLESLKPDHKTIADYRKDYGDQIEFLTFKFAQFLRENNYVPSKKVAVDGTKLKANASRDRFLIDKSLVRKINEIEGKLARYLKELQENDILDQAQEDGDDEDGGDDGVNLALVEKIAELEEELQQVKTDRDRLLCHGSKKLNTTDEDCRMMGSISGFFPAYNLQMITDELFGMIILARATQSPTDSGLTQMMLEQLIAFTGAVPEEFFADAAYFKGETVEDLENEYPTEFWIPVSEKHQQKRDRKNGISFEYDAQSDSMRCSQGFELPLHQINRSRKAWIYKARQCSECSKQKLCCPKSAQRSVQRPFNIDWLDGHKRKMRGPQGRSSLKKRGAMVEHPFGTLKTWMGKVQLKLRGMLKVQTEVNLYQTAYNLKRLTTINYFPQLKQEIQNYDWSTG